MAYLTPAAGACAGVWQSKQWDLVVWPLTGAYYKYCYLRYTVEKVLICIDCYRALIRGLYRIHLRGRGRLGSNVLTQV